MTKTQRRRRKEAKTDYKLRFNLLKSKKARLIVRKTNRYVIAQIIESDIAQDKVLESANSRDLLEKGWPKEKSGSLKSLPAAYLTGLMLARHAKSKPKELVLDIGMHRSVHGGRVFAALKGAVDGGLKIAHDPKTLPKMERINSNKSLSGLTDKLKDKI